VAKVPWLRTIPITAANTEYNLHTLLLAVDATMPARCQALSLQFNGGNTADSLYVGNPGTVGAADCGVILQGSQAWAISQDSNLLMLSDIALMSNGAEHSVQVCVVTR
jgi:hypothetical protein